MKQKPQLCSEEVTCNPLNTCQSILSNMGKKPENCQGKRMEEKSCTTFKDWEDFLLFSPFPVNGWTSDRDTWARSGKQGRLGVTHNSGFLQLSWTHWLLWKKEKKSWVECVWDVLIGLTHWRLLLFNYNSFYFFFFPWWFEWFSSGMSNRICLKCLFAL